MILRSLVHVEDCGRPNFSLIFCFFARGPSKNFAIMLGKGKWKRGKKKAPEAARTSSHPGRASGARTFPSFPGSGRGELDKMPPGEYCTPC